jgi:tetratricopeptide (TPR) repeat protein
MAIKDTARAPFAHNLLGITFVEMGRFDLAVIQFERAMEIVPRELSDLSKAVRFNCGGAYESMGNIPAAIGQYEVLLSEDVDYKGVQERVKNLASINPDALRNKLIAAVLEDLGEISLIGMWGQDKRHNEISSETLNMSFGQEHNSAGFEHFIKGRFKGAIEEFSLAVQLDPKFCAALNNMAVMLMKEGSMEQAETRLKLALSLDPDSAVVHSNMGILYMIKKDHRSAADELNKAIELDPGLSAAYLNLGDASYLGGMAQEAISMWNKIRSHDPLAPIANRRLAYKTLNA